MIVRYTLGLEDHLAWYDYYLTTPHGREGKSKLPMVGKYIDRQDRESFARSVSAKGNHTAFGGRSLELRADGVREYSERYDFVSPWSDVALVAVTDTHLFIAHATMNAHIVPLAAFSSSDDRAAFVRCAQSRGLPEEKTPNQAPEPMPLKRHGSS